MQIVRALAASVDGLIGFLLPSVDAVRPAFCPGCGHRIEAATEVVSTPTEPVERRCGSCGTVLATDDRFCFSCGQPS